jgi:Helix-turn-helix domain
MPKSWNALRSKMPAASQARAARRTEQLEAILTLQELLRDRDLTQETLADRLDRAQGNVSRTLRRSDLHVSTLREVIEAMGGELELIARFPDRAYAIGPVAE